MSGMPARGTTTASDDSQSTTPTRSKNDLLRAARERLPSAMHPGKCMSRRELADAINAYIAEHHSTVKGAPLDHRSIGSYENGYYRWPATHLREAFRAIAGVASDVDLGFYSWWGRTETKLPQPDTTEPPLAEQPSTDCSASRTVDEYVVSSSIDTGSTEMASLWSGNYLRAVGTNSGIRGGEFAASLTVRAPIPSQVGWSEVEQVRAATRALAASENMFGGGLACEAAAGQLRWASRLLDARAQDTARQALTEAVGNLAAVVAFSAFDIGDHPTAAQCFRFALNCADEARSWSLRAATLADMARQAAYLGDLDEALSLIEFAQVRADRLTATGRAMVWTVRARLLAVLERRREAADDVMCADEHFAQRDPAVDPPWLIYYDEAEHQGSTARALTPQSLVDRDPGLAAQRLESAVLLHSDAYPRSRAFSRTRLAALTMAAGDPRQAVLIGGQALDDAMGLHSRRMIGELVALQRACEPHMCIPEVADLRDLVCATTGVD